MSRPVLVGLVSVLLCHAPIENEEGMAAPVTADKNTLGSDSFLWGQGREECLGPDIWGGGQLCSWYCLSGSGLLPCTGRV